jgi:cytochrome oxidase Cu insertion factor (SCO1/SenC/PrrC family)
MSGDAAHLDPAHQRRQRRMLIALALFFFAPLAVSFFLYYGSGGWRPARRVNHGDLIDPARPLPEVSLPLAHAAAATRPDFLRNKWTLLYWGAGRCEARCRTDLYNTRQVRIALNRDMDRVQRVFIAEGDCCDWSFLDREHPDLITVRATTLAQPLLALIPAMDAVPPATADRVYLIDPLGNLMMSYAPDAAPKGMLQDIKRLLGLSQVG